MNTSGIGLRGFSSAMHIANMFSKTSIRQSIWRVQQQEEQVKARQQSRWQVDIFTGGFGWIVPAIQGISSSQNGCPGIQCCRYSSLRKTDKKID